MPLASALARGGVTESLNYRPITFHTKIRQHAHCLLRSLSNNGLEVAHIVPAKHVWRCHCVLARLHQRFAPSTATHSRWHGCGLSVSSLIGCATSGNVEIKNVHRSGARMALLSWRTHTEAVYHSTTQWHTHTSTGVGWIRRTVGLWHVNKSHLYRFMVQLGDLLLHQKRKP